MKFALKDKAGNYISKLGSVIPLTNNLISQAKVLEGTNKDFCDGMARMLSILHGEKYQAVIIK